MPRSLEPLLLLRQRQRLKADYALHLLWLIGAQLFTLGGGEDYPIPAVRDLFPDEMPAADPDGQAIRRQLLTRLAQSASPSTERSRHGPTV